MHDNLHEKQDLDISETGLPSSAHSLDSGYSGNKKENRKAKLVYCRKYQPLDIYFFIMAGRKGDGKFDVITIYKRRE